jgi:dihydroceramidase
MHLAMGCVLIRIFTFQRPPPVQRRNAIVIAVGLTSFVIYHCITDEFVLHVILFFGLSLTVGWQSYSLIQKSSKPDPDKKMLTSLVTFATCMYLNPAQICRSCSRPLTSTAGNALFAYFLWNIDVNFCSTLTAWKHRLGMPWSVPLELHGWWHVMTAVSCYTFVALIEFLTSAEQEKGNPKTVTGFAWPVKQILQTVAQQGSAE